MNSNLALALTHSAAGGDLFPMKPEGLGLRGGIPRLVLKARRAHVLIDPFHRRVGRWVVVVKLL